MSTALKPADWAAVSRDLRLGRPIIDLDLRALKLAGKSLAGLSLIHI